MEPNIAQDKAAVLVGRVRAAQLPPPGERELIRKAAHVPLRDFALVLGTSTMTISRWEKGLVEPRLDQAAAYARLLASVAAATAAPAEGKTA